jgi:hypothetical protein
VADAEAIDNAIMIRGDEAFIFYAFIWMAGTYTPYTALDDYLSFTTESGITDWGGATDLGTTMDEAGYAWHLVAFDYEGYKEGPVRGVALRDHRGRVGPRWLDGDDALEARDLGRPLGPVRHGRPGASLCEQTTRDLICSPGP